MSYYKEIHSLPFVDFTMEEFIKWRNLLRLAKKNNFKNNFKNTKNDEIIQIIYYLLAIKNYDFAQFLLDKSESDEPCITFLKILLHFGDDVHQNHHYKSSSCDQKFNMYHDKLFKLGEIKYVPALVIIGNINFILVWPTDDDARTKIIRQLSQIEQNMIDMHMDIICLKTVRKIMHHLTSDVNLKGCITSEHIVDFCMAGSDASLLILLNRFDYIGGYESPNERTAYLVSNIMDLTKLLLDKISIPNWPIVLKSLHIYGRYNYNEQYAGWGYFDPRIIINNCIEQIYKYIDGSGDNVGIITSYLRFLSQTKMKLDDKYVELGRRIIRLFYSEGFILFPLSSRDSSYSHINNNPYYEYGIGHHIYTNLNTFDQHDVLLEQSPKTVIDFVENYFLNGDVCSAKTVTHTRVCMFWFLLGISQKLWKEALCALGINLINTKTLRFSLISSMRKVTKSSFSETVRTLEFPGCMNNHFCWGLSPMYNDLKYIIEIVSVELMNIRDKYYLELAEKIDNIKVDELVQKCMFIKNKMNASTNSVTDDISEVILCCAEIDIFSLAYRIHLKLHEKFKPKGSGWFAAKKSFLDKTNPNY